MSSATGYQPPPPGYLANQDRGPGFVVYTIIITMLGVVSVIIRFCSRALSPGTGHNGSKFWWDDWAALATLPLSISSQTLAAVMVHFGLGKHIWNVTPQDLSTMMKLLVADEMIFVPGAAMAKASALLLYQRVFKTRFCPDWFKWCVYVTHAINIGWFIGAVISLILMCDPPAKQWELERPGHCGKIGIYWLGNIIPGLVIDVIILVLPVPLIWYLRLNLSQKIGLTMVFILGYSVIVITVGRLVTLLHLDSGLDSDFPYDGVKAYYWFGAEVPVTLLTSCLPVTSPFWRKVLVRLEPYTSSIKTALNFRGSSSDKTNAKAEMVEDAESRG